MKKFLRFLAPIVALIVFFLSVGIAQSAPTYRLERTILPELDSTYELGTSTRAWLNIATDQLCLSGDCKVAWPSGGGGISALSAIGATPNANGATITGSTLNLEPADASFGGIVTTGTQTFAGAKTVTDVFTHLQTASAGNTVVNGLALINNTTASSGNQMYSGALYWKGNGWKTNSGGASLTTEFRSYILPVQGAVSPETTLVFEASQNGGAFTNVMQLRLNSSAPQALFEFGNVSLPGIAYRVDPDTGVRRSGANAQALVAGGVDALYVDVNGAYVGTAGINATQFAVHPSAGSKHGAVWRARNATTIDYWNFQNDSGTQEASLFRSNATAGKWSMRLNGDSASAPAYSFYGDDNTGIYTGGADILAFSTAGTFRGSINSAGTLTMGAGTVSAIPQNTSSTFVPAIGAYTTSGSAGISAGVTDGTNNRRAGLFVNQTDAIWGLSHSYSSGRIPFVIISNTTEQFRIDTSHNLGVGTGATVSARIHAISTTEQLRLGYDASNYLSTTVSSAGAVTFDAVGASAGFTFNDSITLGTAGNKINITTGANASAGTATLVAGTVTVNTTAVTANSIILLTRQTTAGTLGTSIDVTARTAGTSFTITSNGSILDTSDVGWVIIN